jgi:aminoglycoside phosphotransferase (APT) family kinase protein
MHEQFIGTMPVQERHRFDPERLERFLLAHVPGYRGPLQVEQFKGALPRAPESSVLRRKPPGKLLPSAHAVDREYRVITALHGAGIPVARTYALCLEDAVIGTAFYIMEYVKGRVLWDGSLPGMQREERAAIYDELNRVIAALHQVDYTAVGLADFGKPGNYLERQIARWTSSTAPRNREDRGDGATHAVVAAALPAERRHLHVR